MQKRSLLICLTCFVAVSASAADTPQLPAWMAGCWEQRSESRVYEEQWMTPAANTMLGMSRMIINDRLASSEFLQIVLDAEADKLIYIALPSGQERTAFTLTSDEDEMLVFENLQHDFPQRIMYALRDNLLKVRVEGKGDGEWRGFDFVMNRVHCAA